MESWNRYFDRLQFLYKNEKIELPYIPSNCTHNAHMFYIKVKNINERTQLIEFLKAHGIIAVFHYIPLHSSPAGRRFGRFSGIDRYTTKESERLLRLPLYYGLEKEKVDYICNMLEEFYK